MERKNQIEDIKKNIKESEIFTPEEQVAILTNINEMIIDGRASSKFRTITSLINSGKLNNDDSRYLVDALIKSNWDMSVLRGIINKDLINSVGENRDKMRRIVFIMRRSDAYFQRGLDY